MGIFGLFRIRFDGNILGFINVVFVIWKVNDWGRVADENVKGGFDKMTLMKTTAQIFFFEILWKFSYFLTKLLKSYLFQLSSILKLKIEAINRQDFGNILNTFFVGVASLFSKILFKAWFITKLKKGRSLVGVVALVMKTSTAQFSIFPHLFKKYLGVES